MLGSSFEAEDAVQEAMLRAWRNVDRFEGRSAFKSWLYKIATNVCLDMLDGRKRRARPMDLSAGSASPERRTLDDARRRPRGSSRSPTRACCPTDADPAELAQERETLRLAFVNALQHLPAAPARGADPARGAALERGGDRPSCSTRASRRSTARCSARAPTLDDDRRGARDGRVGRSTTDAARAARPLRRRPSRRYDMDALVALLHEDATMSMPPYDALAAGPRAHPHAGSSRPARLRGLEAHPHDGQRLPAYGQYRRNADGSGYTPWGLGVLEISDGRIVGINTFLDVERLFPLFGLPPFRSTPSASRQAAQLDEIAQLGRRAAHLQRAAEPARDQAQSRQRVDGRQLGGELADVARDLHVPPAGERMQPLARRRDVGARNGAQGHEFGWGQRGSFRSVPLTRAAPKLIANSQDPARRGGRPPEA